MVDPSSLIAGFLDETLSAEEHRALSEWLRKSVDHRRRFAQAVLLHDRLRGEFLVATALAPPDVRPTLATGATPYARRIVAVLSATAVVIVAFVVLWNGIGETPAAAAVVELNRLISANAQAADRTYIIEVETRTPGSSRERRPEQSRPPKPSMDGAILHVRGQDQFVLIRTTPEGRPFATGSDGQMSWAVRPDGPVRVSSDLNRFNRDLPGHEHSMPLSNIEEGLERLRTAYAVQVLLNETSDEAVGARHDALRLMVAVKKSGQRGPRRVEITYVAATGQIRELRFVEMPYGPDRLTLKLSLLEERSLGRDFFGHAAHHDSTQVVQFEE